MLKKIIPSMEEAIAVAVISAQEYEAALEQVEDLILCAASNGVDIVEIPQEDVELRKIITIQTEQGLYSHYTLEAIQEYLKGFVASDVIAPAGRYALTCKDIAEMYNADMFPIAFQSWRNGGIQTSAVHYSNRYNDGVSEFDDFVEKHYNSNTFATLHICHNVEEWDEVYKELFGDDE